MTRNRIRWILAASLLAMAIPAVAIAQDGRSTVGRAPMSSEAQEAAKAVDAFHAKLAEGDGVSRCGATR